MTRLVGLSQRVVIDARTGERRDALDQRWAPFLAACGMTGVPLPNHPESALKVAQACGLAALILTGGNDLAALGGDAPERDETERALLDWAAERLPVLGVCRGAQHLAFLSGGQLERVAGHAGTRHQVEPLVREVNSYHDWAITLAPPGADVLARAGDGSIEAFRLGNRTAILWHPEREPVPHPDDVALLKGL
ncbi:Peptidase C26 [Magnetospirillum sp. LM-5]|uniref:gamma-glutamyl-gamma-aminobutyrate hydrolase family protein n=1 Tax=Magnetospirillum sp. LM-5 TaxID=2681466 RepID=UPI00137F2D8D|nr:gamma-glutamyl-gamma-aminobutyrate hydrolase family protein [Magnetospirillum sp. LM-5]CAA7613732.1 Peptidase C26 [Magnetospirillum sp. LM-5]